MTVSERAIEDGMVKVGIPCDECWSVSREWCWAKRLSPSYARLENCCVYRDGVSFGDIVEFCEQGDEDGGPHELLKKFVRVVTRGSTQLVVRYAAESESRSHCSRMKAELRRRIAEIKGFCDVMPIEVRPLYVEGWLPGIALIAFPPSVTADQADDLLASCPYAMND